MDMESVHNQAQAGRPWQLVAAGFNAFGQLSDHREDDISSFYPVLTEQGSNHVRVPFSGWSSTVLVVANRLVGLGSQRFDHDLDEDVASSLKGAFGDHDGMLGCLDTTGRLYLISSDETTQIGVLECQNVGSSPIVSHIALTGNGRISIVLKNQGTTEHTSVIQFETFHDFITWFRDPDDLQLESKKLEFVVRGNVVQLVANVATFLLLTASGEVYSWGDPRYHSLGRSIISENGLPADTPGQVEALGGLKICKIACGGWMSSALSEDGALYIWGSGSPGTDLTIRQLREADAGDVVLVDLATHDGEPLDVVDIAMGDNHAAIIDERHDLWLVGDNCQGQLGCDGSEPFVHDWTRLQTPRKFRDVVCGPISTFVQINELPWPE